MSISVATVIVFLFVLADGRPTEPTDSDKKVLTCVRYSIAGKMITATLIGTNIVKGENGEIRGDGFLYRMSEGELCVIGDANAIKKYYESHNDDPEA